MVIVNYSSFNFISLYLVLDILNIVSMVKEIVNVLGIFNNNVGIICILFYVVLYIF